MSTTFDKKQKLSVSDQYESKKLTLEQIVADITSNGYFNYLFDPEYPFDDAGKYYKFTSHGLTILHFFLNHIEKNPKITLRELRLLFNESKQTVDFCEAACIDFLVNKFTEKFSKGGGLCCNAYGFPTEEKQLLKVSEVVDGLGCIWDEPRHRHEGYNKIMVNEYAINIGIFTFECESEIQI